MIVGILKEIKIEENRVSMTPAGVEVMKSNGHTVLVEKSAGTGSGFSDEAYEQAGAVMVETPAEIYGSADMVMHVKEPQPSEYDLIRPGQILFTYFHFAADEALTRAIIKSKAIAVAYETITGPGNSLPLLTPMSEVAGRMAAQQAAKYAERAQGGRGILLGGVPGVLPATVLVLGAGWSAPTRPRWPADWGPRSTSSIAAWSGCAISPKPCPRTVSRSCRRPPRSANWYRRPMPSSVRYWWQAPRLPNW